MKDLFLKKECAPMIVPFTRKKKTTISTIQMPVTRGRCAIPLFSSKVAAGFPSLTEDYVEGQLDLNEHLVKNPQDTFVVRVNGDSMINASINPDDMLIVDRALPPKNGNIVIASLNGELTVKRLCKTDDGLYLMPENPGYPGFEVSPEMHFKIWGVVTNVIHPVR